MEGEIGGHSSSRSRRAVLFGVVAAAPGVAWALVVGAVAALEVHNLHGRSADNLVFNDLSWSRLLSLPLSRAADAVWSAPADTESTRHVTERAIAYTVSAFLDGVALGALAIVVLLLLRRVVVRRRPHGVRRSR
jgi:hypothetical protein